MKIITTMIVSLFLAAAISAQTAKSNFTGDWTLDVGKSKLPETMAIESMTVKVSQTEQELKIVSTTKMAKGDGRGAMRRTAGGGAQTVTYNLEGKDTTADIGSGIMAGKETRKAVATADGKLNLTVMRSFSGEMGGVPTKTNEIWELLDEGSTLKVTRYMETPDGAVNAEMYFTGKPFKDVVMMPGDNRGQVSNVPLTENGAGNVPQKISGGVLNGKANSLPSPAYPAAARAVKASGTVNVQVTIDENGDVVSASAVSGHPLLRRAAEQAAREAKFAPTMLQGVPVSVTGIVIYNFVP